MPVLQPLVGSTEAPQQHKQPSRKGKKAWRKNVDVTEVQEGLDEAIQEKILFGSRLRDKPAEELFAIDDVTSEAFKKQFPSRPIPKSKKTLKADEIINSRSAIPAVPLRKRKHPGLGTTDGVLPEKRRRKDWVSHKELTRLRQVADGHHETTVAVKAATFDVWDAPESAKMTAGGEQLDFLPEIKKTKAPKSIKQKPISLAANGKEIPAVIKPSGGYSYNPLADDYQQRYIEEWEKTKATEISRLEEEAADQAKQEAAAKSAAEAEAAEARADLSEWDEDTDWEGFESEGEGLKTNTKRPQRKNPAQRNRTKRRKEEERRQKHEARMKQRDAQAQRMKEILAEVTEKEAQKALVRVDESDSSEEGDDSVLRRRQLGKLKIPEKDMELVLPEEMEGSLRLLKPEGNLLKDRYRSMLVRGKLESRRHIPFKKQAKVKFTEKWTHKDFRL